MTNSEEQFKVWWLKNTGLHTEYPGPREIAEIVWGAAWTTAMRQKKKAKQTPKSKLLGDYCKKPKTILQIAEFIFKGMTGPGK